MKCSCRGFTLIELLVTLAILATLGLLAAPLAELAIQRAQEAELRLALRQLREAIDAYKAAVDDGRIQRTAQESGYPKSLAVLVEGVEDQRSPKRSKIYFLRRIPRNPLADPSITEPSETWAKRSYASEPADPQAGDDVYDVYPAAAGVGLNGVPYNKW